MNESAQRLMGEWVVPNIPIDRLLRHSPMITEYGAPLEEKDRRVARALRTGQAQRRVIIGADDGGPRRWFSTSVRPLVEADAAPTSSVVWTFLEITDRKRVEDELSFHATHDPLTRLPNRDLVIAALTDAAGPASTGDTMVAVLVFDLDRFKTINDTFGHTVGDRVLQTIATRTAAIIRPDDRLGRLAGDEFIIVSRSSARFGPGRGVRSGSSSRCPRPRTDGALAARGRRPAADGGSAAHLSGRPTLAQRSGPTGSGPTGSGPTGRGRRGRGRRGQGGRIRGRRG